MAVTIPESPNIGQILNNHVRRNRFHQSALARNIGVRSETIANFLRRPDNRISYIWRICFALNYNFFADIAAKLPATMRCAPTAKDERIAELEKEMQQLRTERDILQGVIDVLRPK